MTWTAGLRSLRIAPDARHGPARPERDHQVRHASLGLLPDLRPGGVVVGMRVRLVGVLVRLPRAGRLAGQAIADPVIGALVVRGDVGRADDDLRTVGAQQRPLLLGLLVGHHEDAAVALHRGSLREADAGVAAGRLHDHATRLQQPGPLGGLDHGQRDAVLDRAAGVHVLELGDDPGRTSVASRSRATSGVRPTAAVMSGRMPPGRSASARLRLRGRRVRHGGRLVRRADHR